MLFFNFFLFFFFFLMIRRPPRSTLFPYRRSSDLRDVGLILTNEVHAAFGVNVALLNDGFEREVCVLMGQVYLSLDSGKRLTPHLEIWNLNIGGQLRVVYCALTGDIGGENAGERAGSLLDALQLV